VECRVCGYETGEKFKTWDFMGDKKEFTYCICHNCGTWQIENIPENLGDYYKNDYYSYESKETPEMVRANRHIAQALIKEYNLTEESSVLDYGGGSILLLKALYREGVGVEGQLHKLRCYDAFAPKVEWNGIKLQNNLPTDMKFDFILSKHCIEHEKQPDVHIKNILSLLSKCGVAHVVAPNPDSIEAEYFKGHWIGINGPRHINILPLKALNMVIDRCGGQVISEKVISGGLNFLSSEAYKNGLMFKDITEYINKQTDERRAKVFYFSEICAEMGKADILAINFKAKQPK